jgi:hypothetical protein
MYSVSNDYRAQIHNAVTRSYVTFTIGLTQYTEDNILQGSFKISNQCTGTNDVTLGAVYVGVLNATLRNVNITRQNWRGAVITPTFHFLVDEENDTWETVPLGVYTISQAEWKASGVVVRAYDNMSLLDKSYFMPVASGTLYDYLQLAADDCGLTLAQTQQEFEALPNGDATLSFSSDTGVQTWRDIVASIAEVVGGFATCDRNGELLIVSYGQTAVDTIDTEERHTGGMFSDYCTKYTAFSVTFALTKETRTYFQDVNDGLTMNVGANPFLQDVDELQTIAQNLLDAIANIQYTPYKISIAANPVYDLGDVIEFVDGLAGTSSTCCVHKYEFSLHRTLTLSGFGADPNAQGAKSKDEKQLVSVQNDIGRMSAQTLDYILPVTISQADIQDGVDATVETYEFNMTQEEAKVSLFTCVNFTAETTVTDGVFEDLLLTVTLTLDGNTEATIPATYRDGEQILMLNHLFENLTAGNHTLHVNISASGGDITGIQLVTAYLLAAKVIESGSKTSMSVLTNGQWAAGVLADGLDENKLTEEAYINGTEATYVKYSRADVHGATPDISTLSQWFNTKYILLNGAHFAEEFYKVSEGYYRKAATHGLDISNIGKPVSETNTAFYIPVKRLTGFNRLQVDAKMVQNNGVGPDGLNYNYLFFGAAAVVNGNMIEVNSLPPVAPNDWTTYTIDISALPYVDYIVFHGTDGSPAYKNVILLR